MLTKTFYTIWPVAFSMLVFTVAVNAQAPSTIAKIETLLKKNKPETNSVHLESSLGLVIIDQKSKGAGYGFEVPYDSVDYSCTYSIKGPKDTSRNVNIKCPNDNDCLTIYDDNKEYRKKNIWFSFMSQSDAEEFIRLMKELKDGK